VLCASGSFGIVRFEKQTDGTRRQSADPDVESGFKELIKCASQYITLFEFSLECGSGYCL